MHRPQIPRPVRRMTKLPRLRRRDQLATLRMRTRHRPRPDQRIQLGAQPLMRRRVAALPRRPRRPTPSAERTLARTTARRTGTPDTSARAAPQPRPQPSIVDVFEQTKAAPRAAAETASAYACVCLSPLKPLRERQRECSEHHRTDHRVAADSGCVPGITPATERPIAGIPRNVTASAGVHA